MKIEWEGKGRREGGNKKNYSSLLTASRAALIKGASEGNGSAHLRNGCFNISEADGLRSTSTSKHFAKKSLKIGESASGF